MKHLLLTAAVMLMTSPAFAAQPTVDVPEMDVGAGFAAIALLVGAAALIRERSRRK